MPVMMAVDCLPGSPQAWDSDCVLSSTGAPHFPPKRPYLKPTKPAQRRLAFTPEPFQPPISNRLTPRLGLLGRANASISHFCCQLSFIVAPSQKLNSAEKYTTRNHVGATGWSQSVFPSCHRS